MQILHIYKDYYPILGGIENHIKALAEGQVQAGHDVTVVVTNPGGELARCVAQWRARDSCKTVGDGRLYAIKCRPTPTSSPPQARYNPSAFSLSGGGGESTVNGGETAVCHFIPFRCG